METDEDPLDTAPASPEPIVEWQRNPRQARILVAAGAMAVGAFTMGALAIGALAIGAVAIGRLTIGKVRLGVVEIDRLVVRETGELD
jgi:hypothetical protein